MIHRRSTFLGRRAVPTLLGLAVVAAAPYAAPAEQAGPAKLAVLERNDAGDFWGTWIYGSRSARIALWVREDADGLPELRMQYQSIGLPETFATDWTGAADYYVSGQPATMRIRMTDRDPNLIRGTWEWNLQLSDYGRAEKGKFRLYRGLDGRKMALVFDEFERVERRGQRVQTFDQPWAMGFTKASKRLVLWDELPF